MAETKAPIDFASGQQSSNEALGGAIQQATNVLVDSVGAIHARPGISAWTDFAPTPSLDATTSVDGMAAWNGYLVYETSDRRLHAQLSPGYGVDISDTTSATQLDGGSRPVFCPARVRILIAGGGGIQEWDGPGTGLSQRLGGSPPPATHVVAISQVLVINPVGTSGQIQYSQPFDSGEETWPALDFQELESSPDACTAVYVNTGELIGFGTSTVQTLDPDPNVNLSAGVSLFVPVRTWNQGAIAPYSFAQNDETFMFLDALKRLQLSNGRSYTPISDPAITATLRGLPTVTDCWGFRMAIDSWDLLGAHFPSAGRTFVYDTGLKIWQEWRGYSSGQWKSWIAKSHYHWTDQGLHLVGLGNGTIGKLDTNAATDMGDPIVAEVISGFQDLGSDLTKTNVCTRFYFKRGLTGVAAPGPNCQLFWRDNPGAWQGPILLPLGSPDDPNPVIEVRGLGAYRVRQWRLRMSDAVPLTLIRAIETCELGDM